jgi:phospholipid/cholesterol/gamma-HCH transport system permease protein
MKLPWDEPFGYLREIEAPGENRSRIFSVSTFKKIFLEIYLIALFTIHFFKEVLRPPYDFNEMIKQSYLIGYKSLSLVGLTAFIMGLVLTIQMKPTLAEVGAEAWLPAMVAVSIIREIGPAITALLCAGRVGSGIGAELAIMKTTEQIDAMKLASINPFKYVVVTRILAATIMVPLLVVFADAASLFGSYLVVSLKGDVSFHLYALQVFQKLTFADVLPAFIKTFFFGFAIGLIGCYQGYNAEEGNQGIGKAANSAVVMASFMIFVIDIVVVQISSFFV